MYYESKSSKGMGIQWGEPNKEKCPNGWVEVRYVFRVMRWEVGCERTEYPCAKFRGEKKHGDEFQGEKEGHYDWPSV